MSASTTRPAPATVIAVWLFIAFAFDFFGLVGSTMLASSHASANATSPLQLVLAALTAVLALAGGLTLWMMKPVAFPILGLRFVVELGILMMAIQIMRHPIVLPADVASNPNASAIVNGVKTAGIGLGVVMLLVNLGIALYARSATSAVAAADSTPTAA